jgi:hypothetical protein
MWSVELFICKHVFKSSIAPLLRRLCRLKKTSYLSKARAKRLIRVVMNTLLIFDAQPSAAARAAASDYDRNENVLEQVCTVQRWACCTAYVEVGI